MRIKHFKLIDQIIDSGIEGGWNRAHKHTDTPNEETIKNCIHDSIMLAFEDLFVFEQQD
tara:strand:+ start:642 stop:818 length:177 start_codon:yes stop_codon:yes gene_type:complete